MPSNIITGLQNDLTYTFRQVTYNTEGRPNSKLQGALASCLTRAGIEIGTLPVGTKIVLTLGGVNWTWLVVQQGLPSSMYDASCNGTWLLLEKIYENRQWHGNNTNDYENSAINTYLNGTFFNLFSEAIRAKIKQVRIPYRPGKTGAVVNSGLNGLSCKIFLPSVYEMGWTINNFSNIPVDGARLAFFDAGTGAAANNKRIAYLGGSATAWWLRSPGTYNVASGTWYVKFNGDGDGGGCDESHGIRPCIILPSDFLLSPTQNADGSWSPLEP